MDQVFPPDLQRKMKMMARDPVLMANTLLIEQPHRGQRNFLRRANAYINILTPGNRWGKSTAIAMRHIHACMFKVGGRPKREKGETWLTMPYETISAGMSADQALIVFRKAQQLLSSPAMKPFVKKIRETPFPHIVFWNGAVMHCRSAHDNAKYLDGHEYRYLTLDEAGWIPNLKELVNGVLLMRLAGGGRLDLIGTPKGYGDLYYYASRGLRGVDGFYAQRGSVFDNPHLPPEDIKRRDEILKHADPRLRAQVIYGDFVSLEGMAFTQDQIDNVFDPGLPSHTDYVPGHKYVQAWDLGRRTDWTVGVTFDVTEKPYPLVDFQRLNKVPWETIYSLIDEKRRQYHVDAPRIDATGPQGDVIEEELVKRGIFVDPIKVSNQIAKTNLVNTLQSALDFDREVVGERKVLDEAGFVRVEPDHERPGEGDWGLIRMPAIPQLLDEFGTYQLMDKDLVQDCVMSVALAVGAVYDGSLLEDPVAGGLYG